MFWCWKVRGSLYKIWLVWNFFWTLHAETDTPQLWANFSKLHLADKVSSWSLEHWRWQKVKSEKWSLNTVAQVIRRWVRWPLTWAIKPGCADTNWSTETQAPGTLWEREQIRGPRKPLCLHCQQCALPKAHPAQNGARYQNFYRRCGSTPDCDKGNMSARPKWLSWLW